MQYKTYQLLPLLPSGCLPTSNLFQQYSQNQMHNAIQLLETLNTVSKTSCKSIYRVIKYAIKGCKQTCPIVFLCFVFSTKKYTEMTFLWKHFFQIHKNVQYISFYSTLFYIDWLWLMSPGLPIWHTVFSETLTLFLSYPWI